MFYKKKVVLIDLNKKKKNSNKRVRIAQWRKRESSSVGKKNHPVRRWNIMISLIVRTDDRTAPSAHSAYDGTVFFFFLVLDLDTFGFREKTKNPVPRRTRLFPRRHCVVGQTTPERRDLRWSLRTVITSCPRRHTASALPTSVIRVV